MMEYQLKRIVKDEPELQVDFSGDELNMIEVALLELYDNVQYEDSLSNEQRHNRMQLIHGILVKLGDM